MPLPNNSRSLSLPAKTFRRRMRKEMSASERVLWAAIRRQALGFSFKRQYSVGPYTLDFYCAEAKLCIEVDGEQHEFRSERDAKRDEYLASLGVQTLRIRSLDLFEPGLCFDRCLNVIYETCCRRSGLNPERRDN